MNLKSMYATQLRVLWEWQGGRKALVKRLLITLVVSAVSFWLTAWLLPNITIDHFVDGIYVVILMALLNAVIRPVVLAFVAPRSLVLTAIAVLVLQVLVFIVAANLVPGVHVGGFVPALVGSFVFAIFNTALTAILGIDSGDSFYGVLIQTMLLKGAAAHSEQPGLSSSSRSMDWPTRSWPAGCAPVRSTPWRAGSATAATNCRAGRRSCRR